MKKILLSIMVLLAGQSCFAAIGYIDYSYMYNNIPISKEYKKRADIKAQQVRNYNLATQKSINAQKTLEGKKQVRDSRKENLYKLEKEYIDLRYKQQAVVVEKVERAAEIVRAKKGLDMIVDKKYRVAGGVDCTMDVFKAIK
mgnify:FL=1